VVVNTALFFHPIQEIWETRSGCYVLGTMAFLKKLTIDTGSPSD